LPLFARYFVGDLSFATFFVGDISFATFFAGDISLVVGDISFATFFVGDISFATFFVGDIVKVAILVGDIAICPYLICGNSLQTRGCMREVLCPSDRIFLYLEFSKC
jgi:hypothetical protein